MEPQKSEEGAEEGAAERAAEGAEEIVELPPPKLFSVVPHRPTVSAACSLVSK